MSKFFLVTALAVSACQISQSTWTKDVFLANSTWLAVQPVITSAVKLKDLGALPQASVLEAKITAEMAALAITTAPTSVTQVMSDFQTLLLALPVCTGAGTPSGCVLTPEQNVLAQGVLSLIDVLATDLTAANRPVLRYVSN